MPEQTSTVSTRQRTIMPVLPTAPGVNVGEAERWLSLIGGGTLALIGLRRSFGGLLLALGGGALIYRGFTGHCAVYESLDINTASQERRGVKAAATVTVNKPLDEVYRFYRQLENHPRFMTAIESVQMLDEKRSRWTATTPLRTTLQWDAEIVDEQDNTVLSWRTLPGAGMEHTGTARFRALSEGRGTEVQVCLVYTPPGGGAGVALAKLLRTMTDQKLKEDLRHMKQLLEAGECPTTAEQPSGRHAQA